MDNNSMNSTYTNIKTILEESRKSVIRAVNSEMVQTYWNIGRIIVEEEQKGKERAEYGTYIIKELSEKLIADFGRGFTENSLRNMRQFYLLFPIRSAVRSGSKSRHIKELFSRESGKLKDSALSHQLSWTHYRLLIRVENDLARSFYMNESINSKWSTRELERQINSLLFERLTLSKDKEKIKKYAMRGQIIEKPEDTIKDPYILEFLGLKENINYVEKYLEKGLIEKLKDFVLELGNGFSLVARQKRITIGNTHYYIDLVFYNYILKCFFLIDLKSGKLTHQDIGQMDFYIRYFEKEEKRKGDNLTVGLILCADKDEEMAKYTILADNKNLFASKYKLYLPSIAQLKEQLRKTRQEILENKK